MSSSDSTSTQIAQNAAVLGAGAAAGALTHRTIVTHGHGSGLVQVGSAMGAAASNGAGLSGAAAAGAAVVTAKVAAVATAATVAAPFVLAAGAGYALYRIFRR